MLSYPCRQPFVSDSRRVAEPRCARWIQSRCLQRSAYAAIPLATGDRACQRDMAEPPATMDDFCLPQRMGCKEADGEMAQTKIGRAV